MNRIGWKLCRFVAALLGGALSSLAFAILPAFTEEIDFVDNIPATNLDWFQTHQDPIEPLPAVESASGIFKVAYVKGSSVTVRIRVKNPNQGHYVYATVGVQYPEFKHFSTQARNVSLSGGGISTVQLAPLESRDFSFTLTGFHDRVTMGYVTALVTLPEGVGWSPYIDPGQPANSICKIYELFGYPTGHQAIPWHEVLEKSCDWGDWSSTLGSTKFELTNGLHYESNFVYDPLEATYDLVNLNDGKIRVTEMILLGWQNTLQCGEAASILTLLFHSQGIPAENLYIDTGLSTEWEDPTLPFPFVTQLLHGINQPGYQQYTFGYHVIVTCQGGPAFEIWDGAAAYDYDPFGNEHYAPAIGWAMPSYWQTYAPPNGANGLVKYYYHMLPFGQYNIVYETPYRTFSSVCGIYPWSDNQVVYPSGVS